ncbi:MAG: T9SS type A sorting domain-containing protein, partial [Bacteroidales bacterium]|nr:T9SS type A sorting domain-containing protein [Bacteroidales bacterium]
TTVDSFGCQSTGDEVTVYVSGTALAVSPTVQQNQICQTDSTRLFANPSGGSGQYLTYSWTSEPQGFSSTHPSPWVKPIITTTYIVSVWDGFNNSQPASVKVTVKPIPIINLIPQGYQPILPNTIRACVYDSIILNAGNSGASYLWSNGSTTQTIKVGTSGIANEIQRHSVKVTNSQGCSMEANITIYFLFVDCTGVGINNIDNENVVLFPNPADHFVRLSFKTPGLFKQYTIFDFRGVSVLAGHIPQSEHEVGIEISSLKSGVYLVRVLSQQRIINIKLIVK